ncbi:hypothetical protein SKAU_G00049970 [Synaphobranchus kaupii]|uniref:LisH domain-containing protein n=1 Tax=Synaphobranchus kaupii TaxID=118154 RepID=A0A9Q1J9P0_SYNKA|nr:hypothetical protein SKAU_G00049970 [Synaphobranchus kaupii]
MYAKGKGAVVPSDSQAREKLALYVYEYLLHVGAQKSAQTFLSEIRWEKNITLGEPPGFLHSWWCVFWDLYCAAPDRRETCEHSSEAKAFHDYARPTLIIAPAPGSLWTRRTIKRQLPPVLPIMDPIAPPPLWLRTIAEQERRESQLLLGRLGTAGKQSWQVVLLAPCVSGAVVLPWLGSAREGLPVYWFQVPAGHPNLQ